MPRPPLATDLARICAGFGWASLLCVALAWVIGGVSTIGFPLLLTAAVCFVLGLLLGVVGKERNHAAASVRMSVGPNLLGLLVLLGVAAIGSMVATALAGN